VIILDHEQGTEEWFAARLGRPSASMFSKLITTTGKPSSSADGYINQLLAEIITGHSEGHFSNAHTERGNLLEPDARDMYEFISGNEVMEVGFILDDSLDFGCSPDGLVCTDGGLEIKCPAGNTQVAYLRDPTVGVKKYWQQIQGCMMVTGREWWDFMTYHPEMPHVLVRVERDEEYIAKLAAEITKAVNVIKTELEKLNAN